MNWPQLDRFERFIANQYIRKNFKNDYNGTLSHRNPDFPIHAPSVFNDIYTQYFKGSYDYSSFLNSFVIPEIMITIDNVASQFALLDLKIYKNYEKKELSQDHERLNYRLNNKPNLYDNDHQFKSKLIYELYLSGVVYIVKTYEKENFYLHVVRNDQCKKVYDKKLKKHLLYVDTTQRIEELDNFFGEDVVDLSTIDYSLNGIYFDIEDIWEVDIMNFDGRGHSPVEFLWKDLGNLQMTKQAISRGIKNSQVVQGVMFNAIVGTSKREEKKLNITVDELMKSDAPGVVTVGGENASLQTWNKGDLLSGLPQLQETLKKKITEYLGVPDGFIGQDNGRAKEELINLFFIKIQPKLDLIESEITNKELEDDLVLKGARVKFDIAPLYRALIYKNTDRAINLYKNKLIDLNEARNLIDMPAANENGIFFQERRGNEENVQEIKT